MCRGSAGVVPGSGIEVDGDLKQHNSNLSVIYPNSKNIAFKNDRLLLNVDVDDVDVAPKLIPYAYPWSIYFVDPAPCTTRYWLRFIQSPPVAFSDITYISPWFKVKSTGGPNGVESPGFLH